MAATKRATAVWTGNLFEGSGTVSTDSGVLKDQEMTWKARADEGNPQTSPEELIEAPVRYANGRDNAWWENPAEIRHL